MKYMLNMLQTKKLNEKYFVNKINKFSFNLYIPKYILNGFFRGKKMQFVGLSNAFKNIYFCIKIHFQKYTKK